MNRQFSDKYENLMNLVKEIFDAVKNSEMERKENKQNKPKTKCRYYNRGYCKEGESCDFLHPPEVCQEYVCNGSCQQRRQCPQRHPQSCKFWEKGNCWRGETCAYLHKEHAVEMDTDHEEVSDEEKVDDNDETQDETQLDPGEDYFHESENFSKPLTTDEILKLYENVELDLNDTNQISTDEILRLIENDTVVENDITVEKACNVMKSTRKSRKVSEK